MYRSMSQPGAALWFARHEMRLAWRDWIAMMTAGRRERLWKVAVGFAVLVILMHAVAYGGGVRNRAHGGAV